MGRSASGAVAAQPSHPSCPHGRLLKPRLRLQAAMSETHSCADHALSAVESGPSRIMQANYCQALETFNRPNIDTIGIEGGSESPEDKQRRLEMRGEARKDESFDDIARLESRLGVHDFVDCEPSGQPFNEFSFNHFGMPFNILINAGAIMCSALVSGGRSRDICMPEIQEVWRRVAGASTRPSYDPETAEGEKRTGSNKALPGFSWVIG